MIARLQRFYGGDPMCWLRMPVAVLRSYLAMLTRLRAEEGLQRISEVMIGTGSMKKQHAESALSDLRRDAAAENRAPQLTHAERMELYVQNDFFQVEEVPV